MKTVKDLKTEKTENNYLINKMIDYECGMMESEEEILDFFQQLVDSGLAWQLQGHYGRTAKELINAGYISEK
jgi:hypothetical protein